jgi:hypothetical protein
MAKVEGDQTIPAEWQDYYDAELGPKNSLAVVGKRYPFKRPDFQEGGKRVTPAQVAQRTRFKNALALFQTIPQESRSRWYDSAPQWNSYLWYYNWFMLSALMGVLGAVAGGAAVIKNIINLNFSVPITGIDYSFSPAVDPSKVVVLMHGCAVYTTVREEMEYAVAFGFPVHPVWASLDSSGISVGWAMTPTSGAQVALQIVEYI